MLTGNLPSDIRIYSGKIDYDHPLASGFKLSAGLKSSYTQTDNRANYFYTLNNITTPDFGKTIAGQRKHEVNGAESEQNRVKN